MATKKPNVSTEWATNYTTDGASGNGNKEEPTTAFKNFGQPEAFPVDRQSLNYELNALDQWRVYFEAKTDELSDYATQVKAGLIELATPAEIEAGTFGKGVEAAGLNSYLVSNFGIGVGANARIWPNSDDLNDLTDVESDVLYKLFSITPTVAKGWPEGLTGAQDIVIKVFKYGSNILAQRITFITKDGVRGEYDQYIRVYYNSFSQWIKFTSETDVTNILAKYAIGVNALLWPNSDDLNDLTDVESDVLYKLFSITPTVVKGWPVDVTSTSGLDVLIKVYNYGGRYSQEINFIRKNGVQDIVSVYKRSNYSGSWSDWEEFFHTGNSVNPLDWGIGVTNARPTTDWNLAKAGGFWKSEGAGNYINSPDNTADGWQGIVSSLNNGNIRQLVWRSGFGNYQMYMRWGDSTSPTVWGDWVKVITEDNIATYIPNQVTWENRSTGNLPLNTKNLLDLDTRIVFTLPPLSAANDYDFVTIRPKVSSLTGTNFSYTINSDGTDTLRTRDLDKNVLTDTESLTSDLITEITFIKINDAWEY